MREYLAALGLRSLSEAVGRVDLLDTLEAVEHWKAKGLDLSPVLAMPEEGPPTDRICCRQQDHGLDKALDHRFLEACGPAIERGEKVRWSWRSRMSTGRWERCSGTDITSAVGGAGLEDDTITLTFRGSAGQSFGAFVPRGDHHALFGDANDYLAKGLSGGRIIVRPPETSPSCPRTRSSPAT